MDIQHLISIIIPVYNVDNYLCKCSYHARGVSLNCPELMRKKFESCRPVECLLYSGKHPDGRWDESERREVKYCLGRRSVRFTRTDYLYG